MLRSGLHNGHGKLRGISGKLLIRNELSRVPVGAKLATTPGSSFRSRKVPDDASPQLACGSSVADLRHGAGSEPVCGISTGGETATARAKAHDHSDPRLAVRQRGPHQPTAAV